MLVRRPASVSAGAHDEAASAGAAAARIRHLAIDSQNRELYPQCPGAGEESSETMILVRKLAGRPTVARSAGRGPLARESVAGCRFVRDQSAGMKDCNGSPYDSNS